MDYWIIKNAGKWNMDLSFRADLAIRLAGNMATVAGVDDGEDSVGRRAFRLLTPPEVVTRCCELADGFVHEFELRGWIQPDERSAKEISLAVAEIEQEASRVRFGYPERK